MNGLKPSAYRKYRSELIMFVGGVAAMHLIFISEVFRKSGTIDKESAGLLGDFIGGYIGTFFLLGSVLLIFATLKSQREAFQHQNFENKYFELLRMHRENVERLKVGRSSGSKIFVLLMREFRSILTVVREVALDQGVVLSDQDLVHISYYALYFGAGPNSSRMLKTALSKFDAAFVLMVEGRLDDEIRKKQVRRNRNLGYTPFEGHQSRLGHYYRHLFQAVAYVDKQKLDIEKYEYVKTIRAQLSNHEQALLFLNSRTPIGGEWWATGFMKKYRMVQNIPQGFFDEASEIRIDALFDDQYFEWQQISVITESAGRD